MKNEPFYYGVTVFKCSQFNFGVNVCEFLYPDQLLHHQTPVIHKY